MSGWTGSGRFKGRVQQLVGYQNLAGTEVQLGALTWGGGAVRGLPVSLSALALPTMARPGETLMKSYHV